MTDSVYEVLMRRQYRPEDRYKDPKYVVEMPERKFSIDNPPEILVVVCTYFEMGHMSSYNTRSYIDHSYKRYKHDRLEAFKFQLACFKYFDPGLRFTLMIVDNDSPDSEANTFLDSEEILAGSHRVLISRRENTYFSFGAYRWAYENAKDHDYQLFVFLEQDWVPAKHGWLLDLVKKWHSDPEIGMIGNNVEARGSNYPPKTDNQKVNNAFIEKINPNRQHQINLDSEYLCVNRFVLDQMVEHDGWLMFPCGPGEFSPAFNELAFQQPILEMGYKIASYDDGDHTMFCGIYNQNIDPRWNKGLGPKLAPFIPEQTRCFIPEIREYFDFYNHVENESFKGWV